MLSPVPSVPIDLSLFEQLLVVGTAFVMKPVYMLLTLRYLLLLRRVEAPELRMAWWGLAWFFLGETCCGLNYLFRGTEYSWIQMSHDIGMVVTFALLARAGVQAVDLRILNYSAEVRRCALLSVCRECKKYRSTCCMLDSSRSWIIGLLLLGMVLPLTIPLQPVRFETVIFGDPTILEHGLAQQILEIRVLPLVSILLLAFAFYVNRSRPQAGSLVILLICLALGPGGFAAMRTVIVFPFLKAIVWMGFWEEASETAMVFVIGTWMQSWNRRLGHPSENTRDGSASGRAR